MHFALLIGYGANAVCPHTAFSTVRQLAEANLLESPATPEEAADQYITAVKKGLLKTFSRMGISTIRSYFGAQIFEAVGLAREVVEKYFCGTASRVGGIGLEEIAAEGRAMHRRGFPLSGAPDALLDVGGQYHVRVGGENHLWSPEAIYKLQQATRLNDYRLFKEYTAIIDDRSRSRVTLRSLMSFAPAAAVPLDEVEPVESIVKRFVSSAMSFGSLSIEAHETVAVAMNRLGARSNCGEGGEDAARNVPLPSGDSRRSAVRQVASGRFGVTTEYLVGNQGRFPISGCAGPGELGSPCVRADIRVSGRDGPRDGGLRRGKQATRGSLASRSRPGHCERRCVGARRLPIAPAAGPETRRAIGMAPISPCL
jgi:glutamate synthase domain-containing protein 2